MSKFLELLLAFIAALPSIYAVLFTPALPSLAEHFGVSFSKVQETMVFYLAGYALGQLPYGLLSNKFGRKPVFYSGMLVAILSSILGAIAGLIDSFPLFVACRFFMACGSCVGLNFAFTVIGDIYQGKKSLKILSFVMLLSAIIPGLATFTGGFLTENLGWPFCFYFLALFGFIMMALVYKFLPETSREKDPFALKKRQIVHYYFKEAQNFRLVLSAIITGLGASMIYLFASTAPFIGIKVIGLNPEIYGKWTLIPGIGLFFGSILTRATTQVFGIRTIMQFGAFGIIVVSLFFLSLFHFNLINPFSLFFPMLLVDICLALMFTTTASIALTKAHNKPIGSSLMSFINLSMATISVIILPLVSIKEAYILPLLFVGISLLMLPLVLMLIRKDIDQVEITEHLQAARDLSP